MELLDRLLNKSKCWININGNDVVDKYLVSTDRELPEICRTEAMFWKAKYYELKQEHRNASKGLKRLSKFKTLHKHVGQACREAYKHGVQKSQRMCEIYFHIAAEVMGEEEVRKRRDYMVEKDQENNKKDN